MKLVSTSNFVARRIFISILAASALAVALPQSAFAAQADTFIGTWKLNLTKSSYKPGPAPRSVVFTVEPAGQSLRASGDAVDAMGVTTHAVFTIAYDGQIHPVTGFQAFDGSSMIKTDANILEGTLTKAGALVQTSTFTFSMDGKSLTIAGRGRGANGERIDNLAFYDKQ